MIVLVLPDISHDEALLQHARQGYRAAVGQIYEKYMESIYQFVRLRVGDAHTAEDITSIVFVTFVKTLQDGKGPRTHLRAWLFQVARNQIYDHYKRDEPLPIDTLDQWFAAPDEINPELQVLQALNAETIRSAIRELSPDQQEVLLLRFDQQLSLQETADIMGKKINTVKTLQLRALAKLRKVIQQGSEGGING
ncbi:MAG: sigma-70 family RNA polymerase sigma factor [Anaerolineae bacterium]|nr:sigma-70 family RNA polymerase sigma factor [Anaerolineae bacterium]